MTDSTADPVWVGIDAGTQSVRALVVSGDGTVHGRGRAALEAERAGPRHEQDPEQWWRSTCTAARHAMAEAGRREVRGVAVCATSGTVLATDRLGIPFGPALMYDDLRARDLTDEVNTVGHEVWASCGYQRMQPAWALPRLLWLARATADRAGDRRLMHQIDFVNVRLTGQLVATDLSSALKSGADLTGGAWPEKVLADLGLDVAELPPLVRSGTLLGHTCRTAADDTGLPEGAPVYAGTTDGCAAQLAAGVSAPGDWCSVLGTTLVLKGVSPTLVPDPSGAVYSHPSPDGHWWPGGASSCGTGLLSAWFGNDQLDRLTGEMPARPSDRLLTYPLTGQGERFPFVAPDAHALELGAPRDDAERLLAALCGIAYVERLCFDHLDELGFPTDGTVVFMGGATRSRRLNQLRADVLERPVGLAANSEPALGAAILAGGDGIIERARRMTRRSPDIEPRPAAWHREGYQRLVDELHDRSWLPSGLWQKATRGRT